MKQKYIYSLIIIGILLIGNSFIAMTFILWQNTNNNNSIAINGTDCIKIIYSDNQNIDLVNPKSMTDEDGLISTPRTVTVQNMCDMTQSVELDLDVLNTSTIDDDHIKVYLNGEYDLEPTILTNLRYAEGTNNIKKTYRLFKIKLEAYQTKRVNLRMWLDNNATISEEKNIFNSYYHVTSSELEIKPSLAEIVLSNNILDINTNNEDGLYKVDNSYYYKGNINNNYVSFANHMWRIVGINSDNTIKLIYAEKDLVSNYYDNSNSEEYVGYTNNSGINNTSNIKTYLEDWYTNNLNNYDSYLSTYNYCNDTTSEVNGSKTIYGAYNRNILNSTPSLICNVTDKNYGGSYNLKIGLITLDEATIAGGSNKIANRNYYLYDGSDFYTMSPAFFGSQAWVGTITSTGKLDATSVNNSKEVRPVINLVNYVTITGDGTVDNPYLIDELY